MLVILISYTNVQGPWETEGLEKAESDWRTNLGFEGSLDKRRSEMVIKEIWTKKRGLSFPLSTFQWVPPSP